MSANRCGELIAKLDKFDMIKFLAKLIVVCSSARNRGGFARDETYVATVALEKVLVFERKRPSGFLTGFRGIVADAESDFAFWKLAEIVGRGLVENLGYFK